MLRSDLSLCQIAVEVGFCDQSYFGLVFRRQLGTTPAAFRRRAGGRRRPRRASGTRPTSDSARPDPTRGAPAERPENPALGGITPSGRRFVG